MRTMETGIEIRFFLIGDGRNRSGVMTPTTLQSGPPTFPFRRNSLVIFIVTWISGATTSIPLQTTLYRAGMLKKTDSGLQGKAIDS